ncbi:hypothetical protein ACHAWO_003831 [Cyclotella atomus]|uniref:Uncharacterized protein n=1 Tax=Cyclotella atomus TaxID=382360 RepID=A0ABD3QSE8_9STRA
MLLVMYVTVLQCGICLRLFICQTNSCLESAACGHINILLILARTVVRGQIVALTLSSSVWVRSHVLAQKHVQGLSLAPLRKELVLELQQILPSNVGLTMDATEACSQNKKSATIGNTACNEQKACTGLIESIKDGKCNCVIIPARHFIEQNIVA